MALKETGIQGFFSSPEHKVLKFLARLGSRPSLEGIQQVLFDKGPHTKDVIEIYGGEGTGKTELLYHILVPCIMPGEWRGQKLGGCEASVIFIDTDYKLSILRITTLMEKFVLHKFGNTEHPDSSDMEAFISDCLKRLHVVRCHSSGQLVVTLQNLENLVCSDVKISAVMIDSISSFYWVDKCNGGDSLPAQESNMKLVSSLLGKLVNTYNLVLFAAKAQVYKKKGQETSGTETGVVDNSRDLEEDHAEFLCKTWQRLVSHRLICVQIPSSGSSSQVFMVGGDVAKGNSKFNIKDSGINFDAV